MDRVSINRDLIMFVEGGYFSSHTFFHQSISAFAERFETIEFFSEPDWETPLPKTISDLIAHRKFLKFPFLMTPPVRKSSSNASNRLVRIAQNVTANCIYAAIGQSIKVFNSSSKKKKVYLEICEKYHLDEFAKSNLWRILKQRPSTFWVLNIHQLGIAQDVARYTKSRVVLELVDIHTKGSESIKLEHIRLIKKVDKVIISSPAFADYYSFEENNIKYFHRFLVPSRIAKQISPVTGKRGFIFFGNFSESRKIELLLDAISKIENASFSFFGRFLTSDYEARIRKLVIDLKLKQKVSFGFLKAEEDMISFCNKFDVGIILFDPNYNVSHQNALPTKLGTYLFSGLDIVSVSNSAISSFSCGLKHLSLIDTVSSEELLNAITKKMNLSNYELELNKQESLDFAKRYDWELSGKQSYLTYMDGKND